MKKLHESSRHKIFDDESKFSIENIGNGGLTIVEFLRTWKAERKGAF